jgi:transposase
MKQVVAVAKLAGAAPSGTTGPAQPDPAVSGRPPLPAPPQGEALAGGPERSAGERSESALCEGAAASGRRPDPEVAEVASRRRFPVEYKLRIVREAGACTQSGQIGALLRREGLYSSQLGKWRQTFAQGGREALSDTHRGRPSTRHPLQDENDRLERECRRLRRDLDQARLINDIQKKVSQMLNIPLRSLANGDDD